MIHMPLAHAATWLFFAGLAAVAQAEPKTTVACPHVKIIAKEPIDLSTIEKRLVCGDSGNFPWEKIPLNQASFLLRSFLETRGYFHPVFNQAGDKLRVDAGEPTIVAEVIAQDAPGDFDVTRYWRPKGQRLTPQLLNDLEAWVVSELKSLGYACPQVSSRAHSTTGAITINIASGQQLPLIQVDEEPVSGLLPGVLRREDAFVIGDIFDGNLLTLTSRRTMARELLTSTHFTATCERDGVKVHQSALSGPPRVASVGVGFNTERLFLVRGSLRNSRLSNTGTLLDLTAEASRSEQMLSASSDWYYQGQPSRHFLEPSLVLRRKDEEAYTSASITARLAPALTIDRGSLGTRLSLGPLLEATRTLKGPGPALSRITAFDARVQLMSHGFEYYQASPRTGFRIDLASTLSYKLWLSQVDALKSAVSGEALWNLKELEPPILVLGLRGGAETTVTGTAPEDLEALPPTWRHFLGGSGSVRGFGRQTLPGGNMGGLTTAFVGFEVRLVSILPAGLQPIVFVDTGKTGFMPMRFDHPLYWSPGTGLRWQSPIGPVRVQASRGYVAGADDEQRLTPGKWNFYFSFGEEF